MMTVTKHDSVHRFKHRLINDLCLYTGCVQLIGGGLRNSDYRQL